MAQRPPQKRKPRAAALKSVVADRGKKGRLHQALAKRVPYAKRQKLLQQAKTNPSVLKGLRHSQAAGLHMARGRLSSNRQDFVPDRARLLSLRKRLGEFRDTDTSGSSTGPSEPAQFKAPKDKARLERLVKLLRYRISSGGGVVGGKLSKEQRASFTKTGFSPRKFKKPSFPSQNGKPAPAENVTVGTQRPGPPGRPRPGHRWTKRNGRWVQVKLGLSTPRY